MGAETAKETKCPKCGSTKGQIEEGFHREPGALLQQMQVTAISAISATGKRKGICF